MESYDIQINVNVTAETEQEAEEKVKQLMQYEMTRPALERAVNSWDFIEFISEDDSEIV